MIYVLASYGPEVLAENVIYPTSPSAQPGGLKELTLLVRSEFLKSCQSPPQH